MFGIESEQREKRDRKNDDTRENELNESERMTADRKSEILRSKKDVFFLSMNDEKNKRVGGKMVALQWSVCVYVTVGVKMNF